MVSPAQAQPSIAYGPCVEEAERITASEFFKVAPVEGQTELLDGVMVGVPSPFDIHERVRLFLLSLIASYVEEQSIGQARGPRTPAVLNDYWSPSPDLLYVSNDGRAEIGKEAVHGPPDLVIEILSASTAQADRGPKFLAYEEAGVRELWLIDPYGPAGTSFFQLEKGSFCPVQPNAENVLKSTAIPNFWIDVRWLWPKDELFMYGPDALDQILKSQSSQAQE